MQSGPTQAYAYKEAKVKTSSQGQIIVMLYDAAIRSIDTAVDELDKSKKLDLIHKNFTKARDIITELICSLDMENGGDFAQRIFALYMWFNQELLNADLEKDSVPAKQVRAMMQELRDAWAQIADKTNIEGKVNNGVNLAG